MKFLGLVELKMSILHIIKRLTVCLGRICELKKLVVIILIAVLLICAMTVSGRAESEDDRSPVEVVRSGFYSFSDSIDISSFSIMPDELSGFLAGIIKDDPYLFFVSGQMSYSYKSGGCVIALKPTYIFEGEEAFLAWDECRARVREIALETNKYVSNYKKAEFLHDYICMNFEYDETLENDSIYSFLRSGKGTCQAYTQLYMAVLRECGIASHFVASDTIEHMWNYVRIDDEWYHADLTWDDSAMLDEGVSHRHFLCSDKVAMSRGHKDWYSAVNVVCNSERFAASVSREDGSKLVGDIDLDGKINLYDLLVMRRRFELNCATIPIDVGDVDGDGTITLGDIELLRKKLLNAD